MFGSFSKRVKSSIKIKWYKNNISDIINTLVFGCVHTCRFNYSKLVRLPCWCSLLEYVWALPPSISARQTSELRTSKLIKDEIKIENSRLQPGRDLFRFDVNTMKTGFLISEPQLKYHLTYQEEMRQQHDCKTSSSRSFGRFWRTWGTKRMSMFLKVGSRPSCLIKLLTKAPFYLLTNFLISLFWFLILTCC